MFTIMENIVSKIRKLKKTKFINIIIWFQKGFEWLNFFIFMNKDSDMEIIKEWPDGNNIRKMVIQ